MRGFEFRETMAGSWHPEGKPGDVRPMAFTIVVRARELGRFLRKREGEIEGDLDAEGLATKKPLHGTLGLDLLKTGTLPYAFDFTGDDGAKYSFRGQKDVKVLDLAETMSVLPGQIVDAEGNVVGRTTLRFDLRSDLVKFLGSFRVRSFQPA